MINFLITVEELQTLLAPWLQFVAWLLSAIVGFVFLFWKIGKMLKDGKATFQSKVEAEIEKEKNKQLAQRMDQITMNVERMQELYNKEHRYESIRKEEKD